MEYETTINDTKAIILQNTPLGNFAIAPFLLQENKDNDIEKLKRINLKTNLLLELLRDTVFLKGIRTLYDTTLKIPSCVICFSPFETDNSISKMGDTPDNLIVHNNREYAFIILNELDSNNKNTNSDRKLHLWVAFFLFALCHSNKGPDDKVAKAMWAQNENKRSWLFALLNEKLGNPSQKQLFALERHWYQINYSEPYINEFKYYIGSFPIHYYKYLEYIKKYNRPNEHINNKYNWADRIDYVNNPPYRWNNSYGFVDVGILKNDTLVADINIATTSTKLYKYKSIEPASANAKGAKIYSLFSQITWPSIKNRKIYLFLELIKTYILNVFDRDCYLDNMIGYYKKLNI